MTASSYFAEIRDLCDRAGADTVTISYTRGTGFTVTVTTPEGDRRVFGAERYDDTHRLIEAWVVERVLLGVRPTRCTLKVEGGILDLVRVMSTTYRD